MDRFINRILWLYFIEKGCQYGSHVFASASQVLGLQECRTTADVCGH